MNRIISPLKQGMQGLAVADLQGALLLVLDRGVLFSDNEGLRKEMTLALQRERAAQAYANATTKLVALFQEARRLQTHGAVDEPTAQALNAHLSEWGLLDRRDVSLIHVVSGQVQREDRLPAQKTRIRAVHESDRGAIRLGEDTTDSAGRYTIRYEPLPGLEAINLRVSALGDDGELLQSSEVVRNAKPLEGIDLIIPMLRRPTTQHRIEGRIILEHGLPAEQLKIRLYRLDFGRKATLLDETITLAGGHYAFSYDPSAIAMSLEVRAVKSPNEEVPLSKPLPDLSLEPRAVLNLVAPSSLQPPPAEYRRMSAELVKHLGVSKLAEAKEDDERQDLTLLNRATGWDARLIALAATTERLSADAEVQLPQEQVYGLLRAGLPSDKLMLAQVEPETAEQALKTVRDAGIVELTDQQIGEFKTKFADFANKMRLNVRVPGSESTYGRLLDASGLDPEAKRVFAPVYLRHRGNASELWDEARKAGLNTAQIGKLQLQGKLAFLAGNNEGLTTRLMQKSIDDVAQLVEKDFHQADSWVAEILAKAEIPLERRNNLTEEDKQKLAIEIPTAYTGEVPDRLASYTEDMARKVRLSYPTQVVGRMIEKDEVKLPAARDATAKLMKNAAGQGFRLGETPVEGFLATHAGVRDGVPAADVEAAQHQMKTLQRVYQITPSNESMPVLMHLGMTSAYDVTAYPELEFEAFYNKAYFEIYGKNPGKAESRLVYRKAKQVSSVTYNLFTIAKKLEVEPPVAGMSAPVEVRESVRDELIKQFPTMKSLFGSMDYCDCEHCRSVLSPAAYFVDLMQFVDPESGVWANVLSQWKATHANQEYPYRNKDGSPPKPYDVLMERRPDLPYIALTCENTHTALPYIDVVNEILEYYVANNRLTEGAAHDTGDATTPELLAEPQYVIANAYDVLQKAQYPLTLPFDLWIETVRQFCDYFEAPLSRVLEVLRPSDDLFSPAQPFDRSSVFMESLRFSPAELAILTDADLLANDRWVGLYGFSAARFAIQNPTNVGHATLTIANADAEKFREGFVCTFFDASANATSAESKTISTIDTFDSGGAGATRITLEGVWIVPPDAGDLLICNAPKMLSSAKTLSQRLGVTYKEIATIVQSRFVNPKLGDLAILHKLGVRIHDVRFYLDHKGLLPLDIATLPIEDQKRWLEADAFSQALKKLSTTFNVPKEQLDAALEAIPFDGVLVLADPDAGCDFDRTTLAYAGGNPADAIVFLRINLFVRLWRKLGWSIEETDHALHAFVPKNTPFEAPHLSKQPLKTALIYLAHLAALNEKLRVGKPSLVKLLTLWTDIPSFGKKSLYAQLFLTRSGLSDPTFDDSLGKYLSTAGVKLRDHVLALQGALGLTADEIGRILVDAGMSLDTAALSLPNVSLLYRHGLLAKALKISVSELITLKQLSGLDPFASLHPDPLADTQAGVVPARKAIEFDYPFTRTMRFVEVAEEIRSSGLKIEDLDYLLRHRFDATGKYRPDPENLRALLKTLAEGVRAIRAEHDVPDDPGAMSNEVLRQKLGLALPLDVVERFLAMMNGTAEFAATKTGVSPADQLKPEQFAGELAIREVRYNFTRQEQKLTFKGVLFDTEKNLLKGRLPNSGPASPHVPSVVLNALLDDVQQQARDFFAKHLKKQAPNIQPVSGFLDAADFDLLFDRDLALGAGETEQDRVRRRRARLANVFLPFLQQRLIRQFIVQTMTAQTGAEPVMVESLVSDPRLLTGPKPLLDAFTDTAARGLTATFFASPGGAGDSLATVTLPDADTGSKNGDGSPLRPAGANSALIEGFLEVPTPGAYRFHVILDDENAEAVLRFEHLPDPEFLKGTANTVSGDLPLKFLELKPGVLYRFSLKLTKLNGHEGRLLVQGETMPKGSVSQLLLYPRTPIQGAEDAALLLAKALQLVQSLGLNEREVRYFLTHADDFGGIALSKLPTKAIDDTPAERAATTERFARLLRLVAYTRLKQDLAGGGDDLIGVFEANGTRDLGKVYQLVGQLARRDATTVEAGAKALFAAPAFANEQPLQRLWEALLTIERFGVPVTSLVNWTRIVATGATPEQRVEIARDVKEAIKARFEPEAWQRIAPPIFDHLRQRQRDALAAHVMHQHGFARIEQLYEYFLVDPGMEPVVQTSRIRLAIASLQLFIQRCLLNMELLVHPSVIDSKQWEWMKRYRVWEANRKIFLFPENWLEPEFRDDKTHLFAELEGALLQGDVSSDLVEDAFLNYLRKLDELARLDIVAMHLADDSDPARRILHVFGRTYSQPHKYFYRRHAHQMWTPWEPVAVEIEGDHLAPVVWRDRLYLFWVAFVEKTEPPIVTPPANEPKLTDAKFSEVTSSLMAASGRVSVEVYLHWSEYLHGEWSTRESNASDEPSPILVTGLSSFDPKSVFIHVSKAYEAGDERGVYLHLDGVINQAFHLAGRNSVPEGKGYGENAPQGAKPEPLYGGSTRANRYADEGEFTVTFQERITTEPGKTPPKASHNILQQGGKYTFLPCDNNLLRLGVPEDASLNADDPAAVEAAIGRGIGEIAALMKPVFYQDNVNTLFVEPNVTERTIEEWQEWITRTPQPDSVGGLPDWLTRKDFVAAIPRLRNEPDWRSMIDPKSMLKMKAGRDWLVNPGTALTFDGVLIGPMGQPGLKVMTAEAGAMTEGARVNVNPGSGIASGSTVVLASATALAHTGLTPTSSGLNIVGSGGFNQTLSKNLSLINRAGLSRRMS